MKASLFTVAVCVTGFCYSIAGAQDAGLESETEAGNQNNENQEIGIESNKSNIREIVVTPLLDLGDLRKLHNEVEEYFFEKFNELNLDDDFDILCYRIKPAMSHISRRVCEPNFIYIARSENASDVAFFIGTPGYPPPLLSERELVQNAKRKYEELLRRMEEMMKTDAEFNSIGNTLGEIKERMEGYREDE